MQIIGLIREDKIPSDNRVALTPFQCRWLQQNKGIKVVVQTSQHRCFSDADYAALGIAIVDDIAYPNKVKPGMKPGVAFFTLMRDLTSTGFYTSQIGVNDIGYKGNVPNQWNGVPADVLKQYSVAYTEKELKECVTFS